LDSYLLRTVWWFSTPPLHGLKQLYKSRKLLDYLSYVNLYKRNEEKLFEEKEKPIQHEEMPINQLIIEKQISRNSNFETHMPYHFNNQSNVLKTNDPYSNFLVSSIEVYIPENMSINLRSETIPMACSCLLEI
jgi:hypothetical protein